MHKKNYFSPIVELVTVSGDAILSSANLQEDYDNTGKDIFGWESL